MPETSADLHKAHPSSLEIDATEMSRRDRARQIDHQSLNRRDRDSAQEALLMLPEPARTVNPDPGS
jgi:hypothetical protein